MSAYAHSNASLLFHVCLSLSLFSQWKYVPLVWISSQSLWHEPDWVSSTFPSRSLIPWYYYNIHMTRKCWKFHYLSLCSPNIWSFWIACKMFNFFNEKLKYPSTTVFRKTPFELILVFFSFLQLTIQLTCLPFADAQVNCSWNLFAKVARCKHSILCRALVSQERTVRKIGVSTTSFCIRRKSTDNSRRRAILKECVTYSRVILMKRKHINRKNRHTTVRKENWIENLAKKDDLNTRDRHSAILLHPSSKHLLPVWKYTYHTSAKVSNMCRYQW